MYTHPSTLSQHELPDQLHWTFISTPPPQHAEAALSRACAGPRLRWHKGVPALKGPRSSHASRGQSGKPGSQSLGLSGGFAWGWRNGEHRGRRSLASGGLYPEILVGWSAQAQHWVVQHRERGPTCPVADCILKMAWLAGVRRSSTRLLRRVSWSTRTVLHPGLPRVHQRDHRRTSPGLGKSCSANAKDRQPRAQTERYPVQGLAPPSPLSEGGQARGQGQGRG